MAIFKQKRGLPFNKKCQWLNDFGTPVDLTSVTIKSQIRHPTTDQLIAECVVTKIGTNEFRLRVADTKDWPIDRLVWDIIYISGSDDPNPTETMFIDVEFNPTRLTP